MRGLQRQSDYYATSADLPDREAATELPTDSDVELLGLNRSGPSIQTGLLNPRGND